MEGIYSDQRKGSLGYHLFPSTTGLPQIDELDYHLDRRGGIDKSSGTNDMLRISRSIDSLGLGAGMQRKRSNVSLASSSASSQQFPSGGLQLTPAPTISSMSSISPRLQTRQRTQHRLPSQVEEARGSQSRHEEGGERHRRQQSPSSMRRARRRIIYQPTPDQVFMHLIHAKQQVRQAMGVLIANEAITAQISAAAQRIDVVDRADKMQNLLEEFAPFMEAKTRELRREEKVELAGRMAAVCLMSVRRAIQQGTVGDLGIDWELVKGGFQEALHREILEDDGNSRAGPD